MAGAIAIALVGLTLGIVLTMRRAIPTPKLAPAETGIGRVLAGKYFVDELYSKVFVRPTVWLSTTVLWKGLDQFFIDRIGVGGTARVAQGLGWVGSRLQNGQVALYVTLFTLGAVLVLRAVIGGGAQ